MAVQTALASPVIDDTTRSAGLLAYPNNNPFLQNAFMTQPEIASRLSVGANNDDQAEPRLTSSRDFNNTALQTNPYIADTRRRSPTEMIAYMWLFQHVQQDLNGEDINSLSDEDLLSRFNRSFESLEQLGFPADILDPIRSTINQYGAGPLRGFLASGNFSIGGQNMNWQTGSLLPTDFDTGRALRIANNDNAPVGYCARGTRNILTGMGYRAPTGNAEDWDQQLRSPGSGWTLLRGVNPRNAPEGALLFFDSDDGNGRAARNRGGGLYGHVEVVGMGGNGERLYISSHVSRRPGGSVPDNFEGAYIYTGPGAPSQNLQIAQRFNGPSLELNA